MENVFICCYESVDGKLQLNVKILVLIHSWLNQVMQNTGCKAQGHEGTDLKGRPSLLKKTLHVNGPTQLKTMLFKSQLYFPMRPFPFPDSSYISWGSASICDTSSSQINLVE